MSEKCKECKFLEKRIDDRKRPRYTCQFVPNKEWIGSICDEMLEEYCCKYAKREEIKYEQK